MREETRLRVALERLGLLLRADDRRRGGLQPIHRALLRYLARCNRYSDSPGAAAAYLGQTRGTVSQSLGLLTRRGLVRKSRDPADGRVVRLRLTARGRRLAGHEPDGAEAALAGLSDGEARMAAAVVERLVRALRGTTGGRSFGVCAGCRYLLGPPDGWRCGLTREALAAEETAQICIEHEPAAQG